MNKAQKSEAAKVLGRNGGKKTLELYGKEHFSKAAIKAAESRKRNREAREQGVDNPIDT